MVEYKVGGMSVGKTNDVIMKLTIENEQLKQEKADFVEWLEKEQEKFKDSFTIYPIVKSNVIKNILNKLKGE